MPAVLSISEHAHRQIVLPIGSRLQIPKTHREWLILSLLVLPHKQYNPPGMDNRNARDWGDVQIRLDDRPQDYFRTSVLTLMDCYWGRYNLNPELPEMLTTLEQIRHAIQSVPTIHDLAAAVGAAIDATKTYLHTVAPDFSSPVRVQGGHTIHIEQVPCETASSVLYTGLDVELLVVQVIPVK